MNKEQLLERLAWLEERIPATLRWDWEYTNHYELQDSDGEDYFWLVIPDIDTRKLDFESEEGQCLGWIIEYAVLSRRLREMDKHEPL